MRVDCLPAVLINQESPFAFTIEISIASIYKVPFSSPRYKLALLYRRFTLDIVVISQVFLLLWQIFEISE